METQLAKKDFDATAETILANAIVVAWQRDAAMDTSPVTVPAVKHHI